MPLLFLPLPNSPLLPSQPRPIPRSFLNHVSAPSKPHCPCSFSARPPLQASLSPLLSKNSRTIWSDLRSSPNGVLASFNLCRPFAFPHHFPPFLSFSRMSTLLTTSASVTRQPSVPPTYAALSPFQKPVYCLERSYSPCSLIFHPPTYPPLCLLEDPAITPPCHRIHHPHPPQTQNVCFFILGRGCWRTHRAHSFVPKTRCYAHPRFPVNSGSVNGLEG